MTALAFSRGASIPRGAEESVITGIVVWLILATFFLVILLFTFIIIPAGTREVFFFTLTNIRGARITIIAFRNIFTVSFTIANVLGARISIVLLLFFTVSTTPGSCSLRGIFAFSSLYIANILGARFIIVTVYMRRYHRDIVNPGFLTIATGTSDKLDGKCRGPCWVEIDALLA
jgi:hypothetical protein